MTQGIHAEGKTSAVGFVKRLMVGRSLASDKAEHQLLPKVLALPVFASDQLSSVAYATEEMMLVLLLAGAASLWMLTPLAIGVALLLAIVIVSYRQTVRAYPRGGGSYIVARENLGTIAGLTAAAAILISYVLTVSVSVTAGAIAVTSAVPDLVDHKVLLAISFVGLITVANLRGAKEAGKLFAIPTYGFVAIVGFTLFWGLVRCLGSECPEAATADAPIEATRSLSLFLVLRAFSSGATALTGVEAIADGVQAFRRPQARNAAATLAVMGAMSIPMFLGISFLTRALGVRITEEVAGAKSVLAQIGETVFSGGAMFLVLQLFTALILILAANTAYQDFPRLSSILAGDRFMPSQFRNRGNRLVFSNGIVVLSLLAALLVQLFDGNLTRLIQLYVVGVFTAITLSQAGMIRRWFRLRLPNWQRQAAINVVGASVTGLVLIIVLVTRFTLGAWMVVVAVPWVVAALFSVHRHYERVAVLLRAGNLAAHTEGRSTFVPLVNDLGPQTIDAISYLRAIRPERCHPLFVGHAERFDEVRASWRQIAPRLGELTDLSGAGVGTLKKELRRIRGGREEFLAVIVPERIRGGLLAGLVLGRRWLLVKTALLFEPGTVVVDVPLIPSERAPTGVPLEPARSVVIIPVSSVHDATVRAVIFGKSLHPTSIEAICFQIDPRETESLSRDWHERELDVTLVFVEAPFRDLGPPLLAEIRRHTEHADTIVTVVLPEMIPRHWWENLLHNQTGLFFKRLLLFEPQVVLASVPFHLREPEVPQGSVVRAG